MSLTNFLLYIIITGISSAVILRVILRNLSWKNLGSKLGHRLIMSYYYLRCHNRQICPGYQKRKIRLPKKRTQKI